MADNNDIQRDSEVERLLLTKESNFKYKERRSPDWKENYLLYRDKVTINRLTQRQTVNLPLMKQTIRTLLKDVDEMPVLLFENLDNDKDKEIFQNEYWKWTVERNKMELQDVVDKRQVFLFGRSFDQIQIIDGMVKFTIQDVEDISVDRYIDPINIDSGRSLVHTHIFVPFSFLEENEDYDQTKVKELKLWHASDKGLVKASDNESSLNLKNQRMADMGVTDINDPVLGETIVELTMYFLYDKKEGSDEEELFLKVEADDMKLLLNKPLEEVIGETKDHYWRTHFPYNTWADDLERQDFWSDGIGDVVRPANKVLNAWYSQLVENRTLRNLNMNLYDSTIEGFIPQTWEPRAWGMYGVPVPNDKKIDDIFKQMPVADLSESLDEMQFVINMLEKSTGATATQQGVQTEKNITLGEVQLALGEAKARIEGMSKFYTQAWKERGEKFLKLIEAAPEKLDAVKIYKSGRNTNDIYSREIAPKDWMSKSGYGTKVWSQDEKADKDSQALEKMNAAKMNMPDNPKVDEVFKRKLLEYTGMSPDEVNEAMLYEEEKRKAMMMGGTGQPGQPMQQGQAPMQQPPIAPPALPLPPQEPDREAGKKKATKKKKTASAVNKLKKLKSKIKKG